MGGTTSTNEIPTRRSSSQILSNSCGTSPYLSLTTTPHILATYQPSAILEAMPQLDIALSPQNDARRAVILSLPMQIEADVLPQDVTDAVRGLYQDRSVHHPLH
jgi:hypothetical protein